MEGCICHFVKWQIHPFISKGTKCQPVCPLLLSAEQLSNHHILFFLGAIFDNESQKIYTAFRYDMEKHNNGTVYNFKLDKFEKLIDISDSYHFTRMCEYEAYSSLMSECSQSWWCFSFV